MFKIAFIGAGSLGFTRKLLADLLTVPEFNDVEVAFTDINRKNLEMVEKICQRDIKANGLKIKIISTKSRRNAVKDAKYVINTVRIGGLEGFQADVDIPLKYGVDQCVGNTLCAGGIMYGQRGIAAILGFCKDIRENAAKDCLFLNYSNPNAMMMDPLVGAVCNPPEIWQMTDEMLVAEAKWLPQYKKAIAEARKRLSSGKLLPVKEGYKGAARVEVKSRPTLKLKI